MNILGIETSCDETSAAVLIDGRVASNLISSQVIHSAYGGVVPELASREHERLIVSVVDAALTRANIKKSDLDFIAATAGPGLIGAVLVGLNFSKAAAFALGIPLVSINHIEAHIFSTFIDDRSAGSLGSDDRSAGSLGSDDRSAGSLGSDDRSAGSLGSDDRSAGSLGSDDGASSFRRPDFPYLSLTVSGGHTMLALVQSDLSYSVIGKTIDDAAGEAFDKTGKMLGLGYPAGQKIDALSVSGNPHFHRFPQALTRRTNGEKVEGNLDFSFSGLKTSVQVYLKDKSEAFVEKHLADIAASVQEAITSVLVMKTMAAAEQFGIKTISIAGGVSANSGLRRKAAAACRERGYSLFIPKPVYSTDNAAMIATLAHLRIERGLVVGNGYDAKAFSS